jgi:hypothetical protein
MARLHSAKGGGVRLAPQPARYRADSEGNT